MATETDVPTVVWDAARLLKEGELILFGSGALAFWLDSPPQTHDVDLIVSAGTEADTIEALMGEEGPYHQLRGMFAQVSPAETFTAPDSWPLRARRLKVPGIPGVQVLIPHPHDILLSKLERFEPKDRLHAQEIVEAYPLSEARLHELLADSPYRNPSIPEEDRRQRFESNLRRLVALLPPDEA